jgi:hypothetical protein
MASMGGMLGQDMRSGKVELPEWSRHLSADPRPVVQAVAVGITVETEIVRRCREAAEARQGHPSTADWDWFLAQPPAEFAAAPHGEMTIFSDPDQPIY